jgi:hypothetical protein
MAPADAFRQIRSALVHQDELDHSGTAVLVPSEIFRTRGRLHCDRQAVAGGTGLPFANTLSITDLASYFHCKKTARVSERQT